MARSLAYLLSVAFHPLLIPAYLTALLCYGCGPALIGGPAFNDRTGLVLRVWGLTFWLPGLLIWGLYRVGRISSVELYERRQRPLPLLFAALGFLAATLLAARTPQAALLVLTLGAMTVAVLLTLLITLRWKISAHGVGMGGAVGLLILLQRPTYAVGTAGIYWLLCSLALAAAVGWSRLALRAHTPAQVVAGLGLGIAVALVGGSL